MSSLVLLRIPGTTSTWKLGVAAIELSKSDSNEKAVENFRETAESLLNGLNLLSS